jgi:hypothetical protein
MATIKSKITIAAVAAVLALPAFGLSALADMNGSFHTFEKSVDPFKPAALRSADVTAKTLTLAYEYARKGPAEIPGGKFNGFANLTTEMGGPVWMQTEFTADLNAEGDTLVLDYKARSAHTCLGCITMVYAGLERPTMLMQFTTDYMPLDSDWGAHKIAIPIRRSVNDKLVQKDRVYVAIGFTNLDNKRGGPGLESPSQAIGIDDVSIELRSILPPPMPLPNN